MRGKLGTVKLIRRVGPETEEVNAHLPHVIVRREAHSPEHTQKYIRARLAVTTVATAYVTRWP